MAKLSEYKTLKEKARKFSSHELINSKKQFDALYEKLKANNGSLWRGMPEAKYKNYTSLQRFWITHELDKGDFGVFEYLETIISEAKSWNNEVLNRFHKRETDVLGLSALQMLSILRHHGAPVPFLDWSKNGLVALFFGCEREEEFCGDDIDNYFSLYELTDNYIIRQQNMKRTLFKQVQAMYPKMVSIRKLFPGAKIGSEKLKEAQGLMARAILQGLDSLKRMHEINPNFHFSIEDRPDDPFPWGMRNNYNIIMQEGAFVYNLSPVVPLEEVIASYKDKVKKKKPAEREEIKREMQEAKQNFKCYNIHKNLRAYALKKLADETPAIDREYIYPDLYKLAAKAQKAFLEKKHAK